MSDANDTKKPTEYLMRKPDIVNRVPGASYTTSVNLFVHEADGTEKYIRLIEASRYDKALQRIEKLKLALTIINVEKNPTTVPDDIYYENIAGGALQQDDELAKDK